MLTGITAENGLLFARFWYTTGTNRAFRSQHFGNFDRYAAQFISSTLAEVTNPLGVWRRYEHVIHGGTTKIVAMYQVCQTPGCSGMVSSIFTYDADGSLLYKTDFNQSRTSFSWDNVRQLEIQRIEGQTSSGGTTPATRTISTQWNGTFSLPTLIAEPGRTTAISYDSNGNLLTKTVTDTALARTRTWAFTYNSFGHVLSIDGPRTDIPDITTYSYDAVGNLTSITNPAGHITTITSYDAHGRPLTIVDPNGLATTLTYNARGWITSRSDESETTVYEYDEVGQITKITLPDASFLTYTFNEARRLTQIADNLGNKIVYAVDFMGNPTAEQVFEASGSLAQTRSRAFNVLGRLIQEVGAASQTTSFGYDNQGNVTRITDPLSHVTLQAFDALNRLVQITDPAAGLTRYAYNGRDQLISITDGRNLITAYGVDALDNLNQQASPDTGTTINSYDAAGNLLTSRDAKNQTTTYIYDALNRVTRITYHDGSQLNYTYDQGVNGKGRLSSIVETAADGALNAQMVYAYDAHGRMTSEIRTLGTGAYLTQYAFDAAGRLSSMTYPSGRRIAYSFDAAGRVAGITTSLPGGAAQTVVANVAYHPFGGVKSFTYGNGQTYTRTIDLDGRIAGFTLDKQNVSVGFDAASRITSIGQGAGLGNTYGYDALDRLASAVVPSTSQSFGYDPVGNRTSKTVGAATATYAYSAVSNRLASITSGATRSFTHDPNGAIVNDGVNGFTYDVHGRLTQAATALGSVSYGVNSLGQRYAKTVQGVSTLFHYDTEGHLIAETGPGGNTLVEYIYLGDIPVAICR
jgi:YD repeat-containing protein